MKPITIVFKVTIPVSQIIQCIFITKQARQNRLSNVADSYVQYLFLENFLKVIPPKSFITSCHATGFDRYGSHRVFKIVVTVNRCTSFIVVGRKAHHYGIHYKGI
jgi:hypothetical protein